MERDNNKAGVGRGRAGELVQRQWGVGGKRLAAEGWNSHQHPDGQLGLNVLLFLALQVGALMIVTLLLYSGIAGGKDKERIQATFFLSL